MTQIAHAERSHALLSASSSHRWLACTPSARLEETLPDTTSRAAAEGTLAHEIAELKLRKALIEPINTRTFNSKMKKFKDHELYDEEMQRHTDTYVEYIQGIVHGFSSPPYVAVEKRINYSMYAPEGFGTADCIIIGGNVMYINDFKYGKGVAVSAVNNPQMKLYALGALAEYGFLYPIEQVQIAIIQPRLNDISEFSIAVGDLLGWGESIKPLADKAFAGEGEYSSGDHCGFCRAKATCRARTEDLLSLEAFGNLKPPLISNDDIGRILEKGQHLATWVKSLQEFALSEMLKGGSIQGWKAVQGRSSRQYVDMDAAISHLTSNGIDEALLYERKPLTVPAVEKLLGAAQYKELLLSAGHVAVESGKPTLAPESDKREAITSQIKPEDVFGGAVGHLE